jgi:hypothetical protein
MAKGTRATRAMGVKSLTGSKVGTLLVENRGSRYSGMPVRISV